MRSDSFLAVCLNPTLQKTLSFSRVIPDEVNRTDTYQFDASGKGVNVARVLAQLGRRSIHLTHLGGSLKDVFIALCASDNLDVRWVDGKSEIRFCYTVIDKSGPTVTELVEESSPVAPGTEALLLEKFERTAGEVGTLVISGSKAAGYTDEVFPTMTRIAKAKGLRVVLDVRGADLKKSLPFAPDVIKPNLSEFASTYLPGADKAAPDFKDDVARAMASVSREFGCAIVLTRGASAVWMHDGKAFSELAIDAVHPVNTTGSGDAFSAGFVSALASGSGLMDAAREGARCGALNAGLLRCGVIR